MATDDDDTENDDPMQDGRFCELLFDDHLSELLAPLAARAHSTINHLPSVGTRAKLRCQLRANLGASASPAPEGVCATAASLNSLPLWI